MVPLLEGGGDWWFVMVRRSVVVLVLVALVLVLVGACGDGGGPAPAVLGVSIDQEGVVLEVGESVELSVTVEAVGGASRDVEWASDDEGVATVSDAGVVSGVAEGEAMVVATSAFDDSRSGSVAVTVVASDDGDPVEVSVSVEPDEVTLAPGEEQVFKALVTGASDTSVTWDASCGSIDERGSTVTYTAPAIVPTDGTCTVTVTATSDADSTASDTAVVTVEAESDPPGRTVSINYPVENYSDATSSPVVVLSEPDGVVLAEGTLFGGASARVEGSLTALEQLPDSVLRDDDPFGPGCEVFEDSVGRGVGFQRLDVTAAGGNGSLGMLVLANHDPWSSDWSPVVGQKTYSFVLSNAAGRQHAVCGPAENQHGHNQTVTFDVEYSRGWQVVAFEVVAFDMSEEAIELLISNAEPEAGAAWYFGSW